MPKVIEVNDSDVLYRFYKKSFVLDGKEVQVPTSLCPYVRSAAKGFGFWISREVGALKLMAIFTLWLVLYKIAYYPIRLIPIIHWVYAIIGAVICSVAILLIGLSIRKRIDTFLDQHPQVTAILGLTIVILGITMVIIDPKTLLDLKPVLWIALILIPISILMHILLHLQKVVRAIDTLITYIKTVKENKLCPPVRYVPKE